jgi:peptide chain release factor 1
MLDKLAQIESRYEELANELSSAELLSNPSAYTKAAKQHRSLGEIVEKYRSYKSLAEQLKGARELAAGSDDADMRELAQIEIESLTAQLEQTEDDLKVLLIPQDPNDEKNVILEIRAGTGGDEATLFAAEMLRMYARYAERQGWRMEIMDASASGIGGIKEGVALIEGDKVYSKLKHESGVHPRPARAADRSQRTHSHLSNHRRRSARG